MNLYTVLGGSTGILSVPESLGICSATEKGTVGCSDLEEIWPYTENFWWNATSLWLTAGWNKLPARFQVLLKIPFQKASGHSHKPWRLCTVWMGSSIILKNFISHFILHACLNRPHKENMRVQGIKGGWGRRRKNAFSYQVSHIKLYISMKWRDMINVYFALFS